MAKVYTKESVRALMVAHYPVCQDVQYQHWGCRCGVYIGFPRDYPAHVDEVLRRTKGD